MQKTLLFLTLFIYSIIGAQGTQTFDNQNSGEDFTTWSYTKTTFIDKNYNIDGKSVLLEGAVASYTGGTVKVVFPYGVGKIKFSYRKAYENPVPRHLEISINGSFSEKTESFGGATGDEPVVYSKELNIEKTGQVTIEFTAVNERIVLDNITWTAPAAGVAVPVLAAPGATLQGYENSVFSYALVANNSPLSYSIVSGKLPAGLTLDQATGKISGMPAATGIFTVGFIATNKGGNSQPVEYTFSIAAAKPTEFTAYFSLLDYPDGQNIPTNIDSNISYTLEQNQSDNPPMFSAAGGPAYHLYNSFYGFGNSITIRPKNNVIITSVLLSGPQGFQNGVKYNIGSGADVGVQPSFDRIFVNGLTATQPIKFRNANVGNITAENTFRVATIKVTYIMGTLGVADKDVNKSFGVYPNPVTDFIYFKSTKSEAVAIVDMSGRMVKQYQSKAGENMISVAHLAVGTYIIKIGDTTSKFIKK